MEIFVDLYIRVSTDEQANTGYSQRHQDEVLRKYCEINSLIVRKVFFEDHSAKSFERPEWKKMLAEYKQRKGLIKHILFLKWDRFSRNAGDSYAMIATLNKLGIEPQAIEQPLDLSIPENKMMLAFYLAAPEVENARRALNVMHGMRRARKEGRIMGVAPIGYVNKVYETGRKYIAPKQPEADIIRWAFKELAAGEKNVQELWDLAKMLGLGCSKNNFWHLIQNPVYCGKVMVPKYQQEESYYVQGQHEPLVSEELFYEAQDVLHGRRRPKVVKQAVRDTFPLRNFLTCPKCGKTVTASSSKGRTAYYSYYHCTSACGWRYKAEEVHDSFVLELRKYMPHPAMLELYKRVILDVYNNERNNSKNVKKGLLRDINEQNSRLMKARELLLSEAIDAADYKEIKTECERRTNLLEAKLAATPTEQENIDALLENALHNLAHLDVRYLNADAKGKRQIIGSIYPEKLVFEGNSYRTARLNEAVSLIYTLDKAFGEKEKGQTNDFASLSQEVTRIGFEPMTLSLEG
jgi:site-specific DNA recombinase